MEWPSSFYDVRRGEGCPMCDEGRPEETPTGVRIFAGDVSDAYLQRADIQRGYTVVVWRGVHVAEPTELSDSLAVAYWRDVLRVARALEQHLQPVKLNFELLGNALPHLHTHVLPRFADDPKPGWPFPYPEVHVPLQPADALGRDVAALRALLAT